MPPVIPAIRVARRMAPLALEAYRRWQALPPEQRERYRTMALNAAERGRQAVDRQRRRRY